MSKQNKSYKDIYVCKNCIIRSTCINPCKEFNINDLEKDSLYLFDNLIFLRRCVKKYYNSVWRQHTVNIHFYGSSVVAFQKNGEYHREDGPAVLSVKGMKEYWINGKQTKTETPDGKIIHYDDKCNEIKIEYPDGKVVHTKYDE